MKEKNLPIKLVLQRTQDNVKNLGGGETKFFNEYSPEIANNIAHNFKELLDYYDDVFSENENVPAVGKVVVKPEAIAKSHKPNEVCKHCPIIGAEDLDEIYIKVTKKSIQETIALVKHPTSEKLKANLTAISKIEPIKVQNKLSKNLISKQETDNFNEVCDRIKVKLFNFDDEYDDLNTEQYFISKLEQYGLHEKMQKIQYGNDIIYYKISVASFDDINKVASISGVKTIDFFQDYSLPTDRLAPIEVENLLEDEYVDSDIIVGIIDGGISQENEYLASHVVIREEYVSPEYQNPNHATFIASTIQYGNKLNGIDEKEKKLFKFADIIALPNNDPDYGPVDSLSEEDLMEIIEEVMDKYSDQVRIWNLSIGIEQLVCDGSMSDLGIFFDYIQDEYGVQFLVSSGNLNTPPLRKWPPQEDMGERDRIISPADSIRAIPVGSLALYDSANSMVKTGHPSPFSRRGPGANYTIKPDVVDYGGNLDVNYNLNGLAMLGLGPKGNVFALNGTSFSTPRIVRKFSKVFDELIEKDLLLSKALLIHSARMQSRELFDENREQIKYFGFGMPDVESQNILQCSEDDVTLIFRQKIKQGSHLEMFDFPYPPSLIKNGKYKGEIAMTLVYDTPLDSRYGKEYCRTNIDASFGTYKKVNGEIKYNGQIPMETTWDEKFEKARVEHGFKWNPIKSYYRNISRGIKVVDGWKIRLDLTPRNNLVVAPQEFVLILTIRDSEGHDIYTEIANGLRSKGYITSNLETKQQIRQRQ